MKKLTLISILVIVVLSQCGYYCFYAFQLYSAKTAAHKQLLKQVPEHLLTKICIQDKSVSIQWEEEGKEFRMQGEMYDVVKLKNENGKQYLFCISDKKEDEIFNALASVIKNNIDNASGSGKQQPTAKFGMPEWIFELYAASAQEITTENIQKKFSNYTSSLHTGVVEVNSPPPNFYT